MSLSLAAYGGGGGDTASPTPSTRSPSTAIDTPAPEGEVYKIGVLTPEMTRGQSAGMAYYAGKRYDGLVTRGKAEREVLISGDVAEMATQLDKLKVWGADAIVTFPQQKGMEVPVQQAIDRGITVVNSGIVIKAGGVYRVSGDNGGMGGDTAEYVISKVGTEGIMVVLDVLTSGSVVELRKKGFTETMAVEAPNMVLKEYATESTREAGPADMAGILTANPQIDAVFSMDDETSIGALQAIRDAGRVDTKVTTSGDGCQEQFSMMLTDGNQGTWLQSDLYSSVMMEDAVDMALDILNGSTPEDLMKIIPTERVDRENAADYLGENFPY